MVKKLLILGLVLFCLGPSVAIVSVGALLGPVLCITGSLTVGPIPDSLTATTADGTPVTLDRTQLTHAATVITTGAGIPGVGQPGVRVALTAGLTESRLRMLANTGAYPESGSFPNDGDASDHDSLGIFQMRPQAGWGTVAELMDPVYQSRAFYGGPDGPNYPSPKGLLDIPGWQQIDPGAAAQAVEVSAYPDRYRNWVPVADAILTALTKPANSGGGGTSGPDPVPETSRIVFPLPEGTYTSTDSFGWRSDPFTGEREFHSGSDLAAADGTPISAIGDGRVTVAEFSAGWGGLIIVEHTVGGERVASYYAHMWQDGIYVTAGETVTAGQHIGDVGSSGRSTGAHLHIEIRPGGQGQPPVDAVEWLSQHGAVATGDHGPRQGGCQIGAGA
ncbi:peptidase M23 [Leucobacter sp. UCD-THU]|uniref:M23 family metallopeptidase n=1 Tax=unclassified Leucobacter TaxID=2621730 RepID=UPI00036904DB|nr:MULTISPECIES: M23 family metallopeptidase [unclassified Leucobacter]EYT56768.1 peptidase M23 [Leucobacter sp. UCD-THU]RGE16507.1 M23 family peptidase [Leucobacter sp. wl10]